MWPAGQMLTPPTLHNWSCDQVPKVINFINIFLSNFFCMTLYCIVFFTNSLRLQLFGERKLAVAAHKMAMHLISSTGEALLHARHRDQKIWLAYYEFAEKIPHITWFACIYSSGSQPFLVRSTLKSKKNSGTLIPKKL
jgi:hypothetical protein